MGLLLKRRFDNLLRGEPDPLVSHLHAGVAGPYRDLLRAVGVAVKSGLAHQECQPASELARHAVDLAADVVEPFDVVAHGLADASRRAVFAERLAKRPAPLAGGNAGLGARDRRRHDVAPAGGRAFEFGQRRLDLRVIALRAPGFEPRDLASLGLR